LGMGPLVLPYQTEMTQGSKEMHLVQGGRETTFIFDRVSSLIRKIYHDHPDKAKIMQGSRMVIEQALLHGKHGFTVSVFYPDQHVDRLISDAVEIGLDDWRHAYQTGEIGRMREGSLSDMGINVDEFVPVRKPTEAERYELHQRWQHQGGSFIPGAKLTPPPEGYYDKPSGVERSPFEKDAYLINSNLATVLTLYRHLRELTRDDFGKETG